MGNDPTKNLKIKINALVGLLNEYLADRLAGWRSEWQVQEDKYLIYQQLGGVQTPYLHLYLSDMTQIGAVVVGTRVSGVPRDSDCRRIN